MIAFVVLLATFVAADVVLTLDKPIEVVLSSQLSEQFTMTAGVT